MPTQADVDAAVADLQARVTALSDVDTSVIQLLGNLSTALKNAVAGGVNQATLDNITTIATALDTQKQALADAVVANTPAQP